jgi:hypothetical protein
VGNEALRTFTKQVAQVLQHPEANAIFPARMANGSREILIATENETLGSVFSRIHKINGPVNVAVPYQDACSVIIMTPSSRQAGDTEHECPIGPTSELGLLIALLETVDHSVKCHIKDPDYEAELQDSGLHIPLGA